MTLCLPRAYDARRSDIDSKRIIFGDRSSSANGVSGTENKCDHTLSPFQVKGPPVSDVEMFSMPFVSLETGNPSPDVWVDEPEHLIDGTIDLDWREAHVGATRPTEVAQVQNDLLSFPMSSTARLRARLPYTKYTITTPPLLILHQQPTSLTCAYGPYSLMSANTSRCTAWIGRHITLASQQIRRRFTRGVPYPWRQTPGPARPVQRQLRQAYHTASLAGRGSCERMWSGCGE
ncbi:hypothetical protein BJ138DRAFT_1107545 [Hygrophoropsis aurantiaca]|uniref:Uncharacterized protein n=1 Tax=Hygrophoropsis aurantiaca TaxID=72124 RepID=A0ACB7ZSB5_9AGAM|nr:hypothetical protein BJ138DRAFT_1107545 [Hygrophoropsis aurantiaca]